MVGIYSDYSTREIIINTASLGIYVCWRLVDEHLSKVSEARQHTETRTIYDSYLTYDEVRATHQLPPLEVPKLKVAKGL